MINIREFSKIFNNSDLKGDKIFIKSDLAKTIEFIKTNYDFNLLKEIIAVDNQAKGFELTYVLYSIANDEEVKISINVKEIVESIVNIFDSALADEKEIYDLFGIKFAGNDELERLYMPECWKGHPLRKDYIEDDERLSWNE